MPNFQTTDGLTLYYSDDGGDNPAVLCLAGLTRNSRDFDYLDGNLPGARLIKMDYRGRGRSDWADDPKTYNVRREAKDAIELMDHLGLNKCAILGTSRGGLIAMMLGFMCLDRISGVAMNDIGPELETKGLEVIMGYIGRQPIWKTYTVAASVRAGIMPGFHNVPESRWRQEVENQTYQTADGLVNAYDPRLREAVEATSLEPTVDLWPFFKVFSDVPVALLRGENSDLLTSETFQKMQTALPQALAVTVKDRAHIPFLDEPESLDCLTKWVEQLA